MLKVKLKKCVICKANFTPYMTTTKVCSIDCAIKHAAKKTAQQEAKRKVIDKREHKKALDAIKPKSYWLEKAQKVFNKYIRMRDVNNPCISCGNPNPPMTTGGQWDCGHYKSRGAQGALRFEELNAHKQCKKCNGGAGNFANKNHTVTKAYRENLIEKIGLEKVEWLEIEHKPKHYTIDDIQEIERVYKKKCKVVNDVDNS